MIDNLAVSGEHAVLQMVGQDVPSRTRTAPTAPTSTVARSEALLQYNDTIEIGKYKIKYWSRTAPTTKTMILKPGQMPPGMASRPTAPMPGSFPASGFGGLTGGTVPQASIRVLPARRLAARWC